MSIQPPNSNKFQSVNEILKSADKQLKTLEDRAKSKPTDISREYLKALADSLNSNVEQWSDLDITQPEDPDVKITDILLARIQNVQKIPAVQTQVVSAVASEFAAALQQLQSKIKATMSSKRKKGIPKSSKVDK